VNKEESDAIKERLFSDEFIRALEEFFTRKKNYKNQDLRIFSF
jgi:hypothetical protein